MLKLLLKNTLRWLNLLLVLLTLLAYLSPLLNPAKVWLFSFLGLGYPLLLLGHFLFILFWLWRRKKYFLFSTFCLLIGYGHLSAFISLNIPTSELDASADLSLMTYNVAGIVKYKYGKTEKGRAIMSAFKTYMEEIGVPDVFCVQEGARHGTRPTLQKAFDYPYFFKEKGTIIFSKFPFVDSGNIKFENTSNSCIWGDLKLPTGIVRVYTAHLQSNWLAPAAMRVVEEKDPRKKETWDGVKEVMRLYKRAATRRAVQAELVAEHIAQSPHPVILCGDFNDTPLSYVYRVISNNLQDSFCEKGWGFDFTYAGKIPGLRIDYVMPNQHFEVLDHQVPTLELSDHFPVFVNLKMN